MLGVDDDAPQLGVLFTCGSLGALLASLMLAPLRKRLKPGVITLWGRVGSGLSLFGLTFGGTLISSFAFYLL